VRQQKPASKQSKNSWPTTYRWLATGTLVVYTAIGCHRVAAAQLHPLGTRPTWLAFEAAAALPPRHFDIPAGLLREAAQQFRKVTGLEVTMTNEGIGQLSISGVSGVFTPEQALDQMLKNTGVHWRFTSSNSVVLELNTVTESIDVSASTSALPASVSKYSEPIRDTPQTVNVVGQQVMAEQNTTTLRDALRNVAGISIAAGEGGAQGDNLTIRGFSARNDLYIDGMRDFGSYYRDSFNYEQVEVLQGPSSVTFGRGSTGGIVNQVNKTPQMASSTRQHPSTCCRPDASHENVPRPENGLPGGRE
jgi:catecholate siderophore receptor